MARLVQFIPQISSLTPGTSLVPLTIVLLITAVKDAIDDIVRAASSLSLADPIPCSSVHLFICSEKASQ